MKHFIITIAVRNGEYESHTTVLKDGRCTSAAKAGEKVARNWYANLKWDDDFNGFTDGQVSVSRHNSREVSDADYEVLSRYLTVL